jgi:hypothetical protein
MTKIDLLHQIYGEKLSFEYDTAIPLTVTRKIAEALHEKMKIDKDAIHARLWNCVYAYGKGNISGEGFIPLNTNARNILQYYLEITGINLFFIPAIYSNDN